ncbi:IS5-like element IS1478 family transposase [Rhodocyclaceae bacterium]
MTEDLFRNRLENMIDLRHGLVKLAGIMPWERICEAVESYIPGTTPTNKAKGNGLFGEVVLAGKLSNAGQPPLPTRLLVGLHYLKHAYDCSDDEVVERWAENPYWQFFTGEEFFQTKLPCDSSSLTRWRQRIGEGGVEEMLAATIGMAKGLKIVKEADLQKVIIDTTVQEKAIAYPTDSRLIEKSREALVKAAEENQLSLRQNYNRVAPALARQAGRYAHARQFKRMRRTIKKQRTLAGRIVRDIERQIDGKPETSSKLADLLAKVKRILTQQPKDKNKLYALHAPEVECISKGKARQPYEFGVKVGIAVTHKQGLIVGARSFPGNPYDGDTLAEQLEQVGILTEIQPATAFVDLGYRAREQAGTEIIHRGKLKRLTRSQRKALKRRQAVEPVIGHLKSDHRMDRNWLKGQLGDAMHAVLCACGYNLRLLLRHLALLLACIWVAMLAIRTKSDCRLPLSAV